MLVLLLISLFLVAEAVTRPSLENVTTTKLIKSTMSGSRRLLVYYPGILHDGTTSSIKMQPLWRRYGDVLIVSYDGERFTSDQVVRTVTKEVTDLVGEKGYNEVVFIGSSLGGLLSNDSLGKIKHLSVKIKWVLLAAPKGANDLTLPNNIASRFMWLWWAGPLGNDSLGKFFLDKMFQEPKADNIETGVDKTELAQRVMEAKAMPFSLYSDQVRYVIGHGSLDPDVLRRVDDAVYVICTRDELVNEATYKDWNNLFGGQLRLVRSDTTHVGYNEMPNAFESTFEEAFEKIGVN